MYISLYSTYQAIYYDSATAGGHDTFAPGGFLLLHSQMRLVQWELYTPTELSRINPELYGCLSTSYTEGDLAPVSVGQK